MRCRERRRSAVKSRLPRRSSLGVVVRSLGRVEKQFHRVDCSLFAIALEDADDAARIVEMCEGEIIPKYATSRDGWAKHRLMFR